MMRFWIIFFLLIAFACSKGIQHENSGNMHEYTNELINESSPYLLQHAHNPVDWYPWGETALQKAVDEDKLIIISIGYAACHWCHVMEHESFEDTIVAGIMNEKYISIKIDREERPDIDQIYMNAAQIYMNGGGGWPLNVIALPDGRPIFAGTYFQNKVWKEVLEKVEQFVRENPEKAEAQANALTQGINSMDVIELAPVSSKFESSISEQAYQNIIQRIDFELGGQLGAPKFPMPVAFDFLLRYHQLNEEPKALEAVTTALDKMAMGGIYDQVGGGFARYSTDQFWKVPHFEKMLYDNAQLIGLYSSAYQATGDEEYRIVVEETVEFLERELMDTNGGFYSSLDADSEGVEGKFYVWSKTELDELLGENSELINAYYNVSSKGNWEDHNILYRTQRNNEFASNQGISTEQLSEKITWSKNILLNARNPRVRPGLDDKILTSWNGLMIKGLSTAYRAFQKPHFLELAKRNAQFILENQLRKDGGLNRNFKDNKSSINGFLDDYAQTIEAFIHLYQATFDESWLYEAQKLTEYTLLHFFDDKSGMFYYTSDTDPALIARKMEISDNVIPASNSVMAHNLFMLGEYFYNESYIMKSKQMLSNVSEDLGKERSSFYYSNWNSLLTYFNPTPYEIAIVGEDFERIRKELDTHYLPNALIMGGKDEGKLPLLENKLRKGHTMIYVCRNRSCKLPVTSVEQALKQL